MSNIIKFSPMPKARGEHADLCPYCASEVYAGEGCSCPEAIRDWQEQMEQEAEALSPAY